ncbi:ParB/RepB/Spo0J family partition protein [Pseudooceanicola algae]|uniref:Uncharacterized protein n=1 Tax=Pseudooceanicola algae TaxID=1537215 RepID=A0A418SDC9_9RHOB|nr:ParB N-terminal domain-containing protein [Pseudooceanicola algae]QPM92561.1 hypothetical protein PSAL_038250 [Pseudooceanicola algae]
MAKRKRLTPANPTFLSSEEEALRPEPMPEDLETKGYPLGVARRSARTKPPIAQVAAAASAEAALSELADSMKRARDEGRLVQVLALAEIDAGHLVRDRIFADEQELSALVESLRARGQQTPIEVVDRGEGASPRYGLISGWRRLAALGRLAAEDATFGRVLALVRAPKSASDAYVAMVEENEIRVGLSYYERARIAVKAVEQGVYPDLKAALNGLFANVSRAKRSKIKSFTLIVEALDGVLRFPTAIGERLGLDLAKRLEDPAAAAALLDGLGGSPADNAEEEQARLSASDAGRGRRSAAPAAPPENRSAPVQIRFDDGAGQIVLNGPGVDAALMKDLQSWLKRR